MGLVKVFKKNNYFTVVATKNISKGESILKLRGAFSSIPDKYSVQIGEKKHLFAFSEKPEDESSSFRFLNHSCSPNSFFDMPKGTLVALKDIMENEEIVFHYCTTEYEMTSPFMCLCGSLNCLNEIKGYKYLSEKNKTELLFQSSPHLKILETEIF
ncbi:MAG: SET domain-containing protein-lysine N-methyltransferase [Bacteroidetes bacterium]|nr:MAG: SET domain-containing protein-lysine N-methyltransferase [Bacteroidota bacterium]